MTLPLFTEQPLCRDRLMCGPCRGQDPRYRDGWAARYAMPPAWPECPYSVPWGYQPPPPPVPPSQAALAYDNPGSAEAAEAARQVKARVAALLPICRTCPSGKYRGDNGTAVDCDVAYSCCGGRRERGLIHLGCATCPLGHHGGA